MKNDTLNAYLACALWSSTDEKGNPLDEDGRSIYDFAPNSISSAMADIVSFVEYCTEAGIDPFSDLTQEQVGHDFWLTRNGHGAGFWDRGLGELGSKLSDAAKTFGSSDAYIGDDGKVYLT